MPYHPGLEVGSPNSVSDDLVHIPDSEHQRGHGRGKRRPRWPSRALSIRNVSFMDATALYEPSVRTMSCRLDPFDTASVHINHTVHGLLHYYLNCYHPNIWRYEPSSLQRKPSAFQNCIARRVDVALKDTLLMNCLLGSVASRIQYVDKSVQLPGACEMELSCMQDALRLVRERIKDVEHQDATFIEHTANCIILLASAEGYQGNTGNARLHVQAAVQLLESIGGVFALHDQYMLGHILSLDSLLSCAVLKPCMIKCDYDPGPASIEGLAKAEARSIRDDATSEWMKGTLKLPLTLMWLISEIVECHETKRRFETASRSFSQALAPSDWVTMRVLAIRSKLLSFSATDSTSNALRVALIMWTLLATEEWRQMIVARTMTPKLRSIVGETLDWDGLEGVRFWVLLMGYFCAGENSELQSWFAEQVRVVRKLHGSDLSIPFQKAERNDLLDDLISLQRRFPYHERVQRPLTRKLADWLLWWDDFMT